MWRNHTTAPIHKTALYFPDFPSCCATTPISKLPGTHTTWWESEEKNHYTLKSSHLKDQFRNQMLKSLLASQWIILEFPINKMECISKHYKRVLIYIYGLCRRGKRIKQSQYSYIILININNKMYKILDRTKYNKEELHTSMFSSLTEYFLKVSKAPSNSSFVTSSLNRATTLMRTKK